MATVKEQAIEAMRRLPDDCTWDDVAYQVYVRRKVEAGLAAIDRGDVYSPEDAKRMVKQWLKSSGPVQP
jgi:aryl-alcohol dehydrogenase-like predicted oxidoreductase